MGRKEKTLAAMESSPSGWRYDEVASVLQAFGFTERRTASSHRKWTHPKADPISVVAGSRKVAEYQVQQATRAIRLTMEDA
jgi:predicted RNA binding protein YcfA (HicA-like mRNA interferase family)